MSELDALLAYSDTWDVQPSIYVATIGKVKNEWSGDPQYVIGECNRGTPIRCLGVLFRSLRIIRRERPDVILTTGSLPLALFCLVGRVFGARIIWIDSISQVDELSLSGRLVMRFAHLFLVQWPALAKRYDRARYEGELV